MVSLLLYLLLPSWMSSEWSGCDIVEILVSSWNEGQVPTSSAASADKTAAHCSVDVKMSGTLEEHLKKVHTLSQNVEFLLCVQLVLSDVKTVSRGHSWAILPNDCHLDMMRCRAISWLTGHCEAADKGNGDKGREEQQ